MRGAMNRTQKQAAGDMLTAAERRHLLRRLAFAAAPDLEETIRGLSADDALGVLLRAAQEVPYPDRPEVARGIWSNPSLRLAGTSDEDFEAILDQQAEHARRPAGRARAR